MKRVLGPTADYIGGNIRDLAKTSVENIGRIFRAADRKLPPKAPTDEKIPPRVLRDVINTGAFCDDELWAEYFGGVLASIKPAFQ